MNRKTNKAFIVELLALFALLIMVITVITVISIRTRSESMKAKELSEAVLCAQNTAEITAPAADGQEAAGLIEQMDGAEDVSLAGGFVSFLLAPTKADRYRVTVEVELDPGETGIFTTKRINVYAGDKQEGEPLYTMESGNFIKDGEEMP